MADGDGVSSLVLRLTLLLLLLGMLELVLITAIVFFISICNFFIFSCGVVAIFYVQLRVCLLMRAWTDGCCHCEGIASLQLQARESRKAVEENVSSEKVLKMSRSERNVKHGNVVAGGAAGRGSPGRVQCRGNLTLLWMHLVFLFNW
jgi:hypothetical protein